MVNVFVMHNFLTICILIALIIRHNVCEKCSFEACPETKPDMINVHLICHTHDDLGWLKTVEQYFYGTNQTINKNGVQYILNSVINELSQDPSRKFSYAETGYLWMWWNTQSNKTKLKVKQLVSEGQLEFIGGGWGQHDEASPHYAGIIDMMTIGHRFLAETFGRCGVSKIAWQIDPFGHSRETASLFSLMGLDALFLGRIHYNDRIKRLKNKSLNMIWHGSDDIGTYLGSDSDILTSAFYDFYTPPSGFCFDELCDDDPIIDDSNSPEYNIPKKVADFVALVKQQASNYTTNNIMLNMGSDFTYMNANRWFVNLDKLINNVNILQSQGSNINVFYSTPTCYAQSVINTQTKFPEKTDDFFPHANDVHSYWTGYFTSRPSFKGFIRWAGNVLQVCQALESFTPSANKSGDINVLHRALAIMQDHNSITGCAKQHTTNDYSKKINEGIDECQKLIRVAMEELSRKQSDRIVPYFTFCNSLNVTICNVSQTSDKFLVTVHNGLSKHLKSFVRIPVSSKSYSVFKSDGDETAVQVIKTFKTDQISYPDRAPFEMILPVDVNPIGYETYFIEKNDKIPLFAPVEKFDEDEATSNCIPCTIKNEFLSVSFDRHGLLQSVTDLNSKIKTKINQNFYWYRGMDNSVKGSQPSGAFIFRPNGTDPFKASKNYIRIQKVGKTGDFVQEVRQKFSDWISQTIRLYNGKPYIEFQWSVGPIPFKDNISREIISRFDSDIQSNNLFYTDSNGRQIMERRRNFQPTYTYNDSEPVAGNYYPITTHIYIKVELDSTRMLTVLTDRGQGGSSMKDGSIELMVHRRLLQDDWFGVDEALNETGNDGRGLVATGKHWLFLSKSDQGPRLHRTFAQEMFYQPLMTFARWPESFEEYRKNFAMTFSGLTKPLPVNINILTISKWKDDQMLLRLEHLFQKMEDDEFSKPVLVELKDLFTKYEIISIAEKTLSASQELVTKENISSNFSITLTPMQIRTFVVNVKHKI